MKIVYFFPQLARHAGTERILIDKMNYLANQYGYEVYALTYEQDSDFDQQSYVLKAPADDSPIDIQQIFDFMDNFQMNPKDIRRTVEHLAWNIQMQRVVDAVF